MSTPAKQELVIVGCGPAGLAAANLLRASGRPFTVLEAGKALGRRDRENPRDIIAGVGGAGLYSDGKFSFYPAGTRVWRLDDEARVRRAYARVRSWLHEHELDAPTLPAALPPIAAISRGFKRYPSCYLGLEPRAQLIRGLFERVADRVILETRLTDVARDPDGLRLTIHGPDGARSLATRRLLLAGGRLLPLALRGLNLGLPTRFRRVEFGVRLEGAADHPFFAELLELGRSIDPKLILRRQGEPGVEWRTFCCCVQGELVAAKFKGLWALSGRSDGPASGRSNIGFNVRVLDPEHAAALEQTLARVRARGLFQLPLAAALAERPAALEEALGVVVGAAVREGLRRLSLRIPSLRARPITVHGPTIEGVGFYPNIDSALAVRGLPIEVAGDASGAFRGLVPALVSGAYLGLRHAGA